MSALKGNSTGLHIDCASCQARINGLCGEIPPEALQMLAASKVCDRRVKAGQDLFALGDTSELIFNVVDGWIARYCLLPDGRRQILDFALPGAMLGFHSGMDSTMTHGAQALTDAVVCVVPQNAFDSICRQHPEVALRLASFMSREQNLWFAHLTSIGRRPACVRVAQLLLELFVRYRSRWPGHRVEEMHLPLTQENIGDATGLTGVHVNRILAEFKAAGILQFCYHKLRILDPDALVDAADIEPELLQSWIGRFHAERNVAPPILQTPLGSPVRGAVSIAPAPDGGAIPS